MKKVRSEQVKDPTQIKVVPIVIVLVLAAFVTILNQTLMNIALPQIMNDLSISANTGQWLTTGFMMTNGVLIPVTAFLIERFTTRKLYMTAMSLFGIGTLICAVAPDFPLLLTGRIVQAAGAGIMMPLMMTSFLYIFPVEKRGRAMGIIGLAIIFAPAIGPTLSGWIVQNYSWRVLFYMMIPITILALVLAHFMLRNVTRQTLPKVDVFGITLSTLGFGGLLYGFSIAGNTGWEDYKVFIGLAVGVVALILFITRELKSKTPMLEFRVFKYPIFSLATLINMVVTMAMFAGMILVPIYLQNIRGFSPLESGLLLLPGAILMGIMSPITGYLFDKIGARPLALVGLAITAITTFGFSNLADDTTYTLLILMYTARMFGMSMLMMPIMTAGLNQLPQKWNAHGTAMVNTTRMISGAIGTAVLITVMSNRTKEHLTSMLSSKGIQLPKGVGGNISGSASQAALAKLPPEVQQQLMSISNHAEIKGINDAFLVATGLAILALLLSFFLIHTKPSETIKRKEAEEAEEAKKEEAKGNVSGNRKPATEH